MQNTSLKSNDSFQISQDGSSVVAL